MDPEKIRRRLTRIKREEAQERRRIRWFVGVLVGVLVLIAGPPYMIWKFSDHTVKPADQQLSLDALIALPMLWQAATHPSPPVAQPVSPASPQVMYIALEGLNYRSAPRIDLATLRGEFPYGTKIKVVDIVRGDNPDKKGATAPWYRLDTGMYVIAKYVTKSDKLPRCVLPFSGGGWRLSSVYGWRIDPNYHYRKKHEGYDFAAAAGTPIRSVTAGTVIASGKFDPNGFGAWVFIRDEQGRGWAYAHVDWRSVLPVGTKVRPSTIIARVGHKVGKTTGDHLHLAMDRDARRGSGGYDWVDSRSDLAKCGVKLPPKT